MNNFDWLHGTWQTTQRKMVKPLSGNDEWVSTDARWETNWESEFSR